MTGVRTDDERRGAAGAAGDRERERKSARAVPTIITRFGQMRMKVVVVVVVVMMMTMSIYIIKCSGSGI